MNNRLKFRFWDKKNNTMWNDEDISMIFIEGGKFVGLFDTGSQYLPIETAENTVVMQCTGVKDKNGKEIYECDMVKTTEYIGIVKYYKGMYCINVDDSFKLSMYETNEFMEVIGNIYETPDLLK